MLLPALSLTVISGNAALAAVCANAGCIASGAATAANMVAAIGVKR
jgi:hypothetical protein